jgi:hypothetical protein
MRTVVPRITGECNSGVSGDRKPAGTAASAIKGYLSQRDKRLGHLRAKKFEGKNILAELRWCRDTAVALRNFAMEIDYALTDYRRPWPDRPHLPIRKLASERKPRHPVQKAKHARPPQSSAA